MKNELWRSQFNENQDDEAVLIRGLWNESRE